MKKNLFDLSGRVALVTGASSGLGVQIAKALANQGADLAIVARRLEKLEAVKAEIEKDYGVKVYAHHCDVSNVEEIKSTVDDVLKEYGKIDILVNNAGIALCAPADKLDDKSWDMMMRVNISADFYFAREVASKSMLKNHYGKIINLGSIHSTVAMVGLPITSYATTKGGVLMLTKSLANEWAKEGITVNAIGPAYFESEMTGAFIGDAGFQQLIAAYCPMGRTGRAGELDGAIAYFASDASSYTTGQLLQIDGGWTTI